MARRIGGISCKRLFLRRMSWKRMCSRFEQRWVMKSRCLSSTSCERPGLTLGRPTTRGHFDPLRLQLSALESAWLHSARPMRMRVGNSWLARHFLPADFDDYYEHHDPTLPCGLRQEEVLDIMFREIKPEDFELLSKLDESVPKRNTVQRSLVEDLPQVLARDCAVEECGVCLAQLPPKVRVAKLPCQHAFHLECIGKWLTQCKNACPLCSAPIQRA